uniref:transposase n=1 Tax=Arsenophonus nasoniae TaxID=638 RepID=UPI001FE2CBA1|nr:transposase [Arsenophonus nasoniae]
MDSKHSVWRKLFSKKGCRRNLARAVIRLLRHSYDLINPGLLPGLGHIRDKKHWRRYLRAQYGRYWKVHFAKKNERAWHSVKYLGRYLKRPPVSASKLRHYRGGAVVHHYHDHRTGQHRQQTLPQEEMIRRYMPYSGQAF